VTFQEHIYKRLTKSEHENIENMFSKLKDMHENNFSFHRFLFACVRVEFKNEVN